MCVNVATELTEGHGTAADSNTHETEQTGGVLLPCYSGSTLNLASGLGNITSSQLLLPVQLTDACSWEAPPCG